MSKIKVYAERDEYDQLVSALDSPREGDGLHLVAKSGCRVSMPVVLALRFDVWKNIAPASA